MPPSSAISSPGFQRVALKKLFHSVTASEREKLYPAPCVCAFIIPHPAFCVAQRGEGTDCHTSCHIQTLSPVRSAWYEQAALADVATPRFTISLINGNYPKLTERFPPPHPALADMKNPGEASLFLPPAAAPAAAGPGGWMLAVCLRDFISPLAVRSDRNRVPPRRNRCPPNHVGNLNQFL